MNKKIRGVGLVYLRIKEGFYFRSNPRCAMDMRDEILMSKLIIKLFTLKQKNY